MLCRVFAYSSPILPKPQIKYFNIFLIDKTKGIKQNFIPFVTIVN
jgi:hypothetical protein